MWNPKLLEKQAGQMRGDEVWPGLEYVPGVDMEKVLEIREGGWCSGSKADNAEASNQKEKKDTGKYIHR